MTGKTGAILECPRCGESIPSWQPVHLGCFIYRIRVVAWILAASVAIPGSIYAFRMVGMTYDSFRAVVLHIRTPGEEQPVMINRPAPTRSAVISAPEGSAHQSLSPTKIAVRPTEPRPGSLTPTGGEEAALEPRAKIGDRWVLRSEDMNNPKWSNTTERKVLQASETQVVVSSRNTHSNYTRTLVFTPSWNLIQSREPDGKGYDYSPPLKYFDFPLFPGKKWVAEVEEKPADGRPTRMHQLSAVVEGWEDITVPAGTFRALKIALQVKALEESVVTRSSEDVSWYAPKVKRSVKTVETSVNHLSDLRTMRTVTLIDFAVSD